VFAFQVANVPSIKTFPIKVFAVLQISWLLFAGINKKCLHLKSDQLNKVLARNFALLAENFCARVGGEEKSFLWHFSLEPAESVRLIFISNGAYPLEDLVLKFLWENSDTARGR